MTSSSDNPFETLADPGFGKIIIAKVVHSFRFENALQADYGKISLFGNSQPLNSIVILIFLNTKLAAQFYIS